MSPSVASDAKCFSIVSIPADGIGPEVVDAATAVRTISEYWIRECIIIQMRQIPYVGEYLLKLIFLSNCCYRVNERPMLVQNKPNPKVESLLPD